VAAALDSVARQRAAAGPRRCASERNAMPPVRKPPNSADF
jgi:hypothetical protein